MSFSDFANTKFESFKNTLNSFKLDLNEDFSKLEVLKTEDFITESVSGDRLDISIGAKIKDSKISDDIIVSLSKVSGVNTINIVSSNTDTMG